MPTPIRAPSSDHNDRTGDRARRRGRGGGVGPWGDGAGADGAAPGSIIERDPAVSADGRRVAYVAPSSDESTGAPLDSVWLLDRADGTRLELTIRDRRDPPRAQCAPGVERRRLQHRRGDRTRPRPVPRRRPRQPLGRVPHRVLPSCPGGFEQGGVGARLVGLRSRPGGERSRRPHRPSRHRWQWERDRLHLARRVAGGTVDPVSWTSIDVVDLAVPLGSAGRLVPIPVSRRTARPSRGRTSANGSRRCRAMPGSSPSDPTST